MSLGTQKFRTGANLYANAAIIDIPGATTTQPRGVGGQTIASFSSNVVQDPDSILTNTGSDIISLTSGTFEIRVASISEVDYSSAGSYADLSLQFGLMKGFPPTQSAGADNASNTFAFALLATDSDSDDDDKFFETGTIEEIRSWSGTPGPAGEGSSGSYTNPESNVVLPKILTGIVGGNADHKFQSFWVLADGPQQTITGPTVRLIIRKTS